MPKNPSLLVCVVLLTISATSARAETNDGGSAEFIPPLRLYGGAWFGFKGEAESEREPELKSDVSATLGGQVGIERVLWRHLSLGVEARFGASKWTETGDRTKLIDVDLKPRIRFPLRNTPIELYLAVPVGLTVPRGVKVDEEDAKEKVGWNLGAGPGLNLFLTDWLGLNAEPVWLFHHFAVEGEEEALEIRQFSVFANAVIALQ